MKFDIDEIIELVNGKRYIVVDKLEENYIWYYNVYEVDDNNNVLDTSLIVKNASIKLAFNSILPVFYLTCIYFLK